MPELEKPCRLWTGAKHPKGYGMCWVPGRGDVRVHRRAWEETYGPIPTGMLVCHHCDTPACYEPTHLFLGTNRDNMRDAVSKARFARGEDRADSKLTAEQVAEMRAIGMSGNKAAMARRYGVCRTTVKAILEGRSWQPRNEEGQP